LNICIKKEKADFDGYYRAIWGERWAVLRAALCAERPRYAYSRALKKPYRLDRASALAACELPLAASGAPPLILDACAAPGGKTLVLAGRMGGGAHLVANELSPERRRRLSGVLDEHLAEDARRQVRVSGFDAAALAGKKNERARFDAILLDAPCSSERHVLACATQLGRWSPARPAALARRQWALLSAAFLLVKAGGTILYVTCALNPAENDGVVARLLEKYGAAAKIEACTFTGGGWLEPSPPAGEPTATGRLILPDVCNGMGPLFAAKIRKVEAVAKLQFCDSNLLKTHVSSDCSPQALA
jgi:16S rRNA (cytosine1407-C5)-methyltransferase